jgi:hypothetical protein
VAAGHVVAFSVAIGLSAVCATSGACLCNLRVSRARRLLTRGTRATARIVEVVPSCAAGQAFPSDAARIVVEYPLGDAVHRETIVLANTAEECYRVGDALEVYAAPGLPPRARTSDEPNITYGTIEQVVGAALVILAGLPLFIMFSVHALTP